MKKYLFTIVVMIVIFTFLYYNTNLFDFMKANNNADNVGESITEDSEVSDTDSNGTSTDSSINLPTDSIE